MLQLNLNLPNEIERAFLNIIKEKNIDKEKLVKDLIMEYLKDLQKNKQNLTENGYTPEFEASILKEAEHMKKNPHLYKSYSSIDEMFKALESE